MLKHIVLFKRHEGVEKAEFDSVINKFADLPASIPVIAGWWFRLPEGAETGYEAGFVSEFASDEDLTAYQVHPAHEELAKAAGAVASAAVFDAWD